MSSDASDVIADISALYYYEYRLAVYYNLFVGIVYGIYIVLYATSVYILLSRPGFTSSQPRMFMFGITTFMFILGIITLVLETAVRFQDTQLSLLVGGTDADVRSLNRMSEVILIFSRLMYILSDVICAWRAVVLWNRDKRTVAILLLSILGTIAAAGYDINPRNEYDLESVLIFAGPTLGTNLLSTWLIAWKFWQRRISVRKHLNEGSGSVRVDRIFAMLIESGFVYCCLWICYLISVLAVLPEQWYEVLNNGLIFVAGLYPTLIVILVSIQMSPVEYHSTHSPGMQFTRNPAPVPPSMSQHVYQIGREYVSDSDTHVPSAVFIEISNEEKSLSVG